MRTPKPSGKKRRSVNPSQPEAFAKQVHSWSWTNASGSSYGISVEIDPKLPGGGRVAAYTMGLPAIASAGTDCDFADLDQAGFPGPQPPSDIFQEVWACIQGGRSAPLGTQPPLKTEDSKALDKVESWTLESLHSSKEGHGSGPVVPEGNPKLSWDWQEGMDWEFDYLISVYENGVLFRASGEVEKGITPHEEFIAFPTSDRAARRKVSTPYFMSTGGAYFKYEEWRDE